MSKTPICDMIESSGRLCLENNCQIEFVKLSPMLWYYFGREIFCMMSGEITAESHFVYSGTEAQYAGVRVLLEPRFAGSSFAVLSKEKEFVNLPQPKDANDE